MRGRPSLKFFQRLVILLEKHLSPFPHGTTANLSQGSGGSMPNRPSPGEGDGRFGLSGMPSA